MFPPATSTLSLDAYLLRYNKPKLVHMTKKCKRSPSSSESLRYRRLIKTFLKTLTAGVLKEHLRHAAEKKKMSLESYLQKHQWNILKTIGANQMIIDRIYPRVSESLKLTTWGPLLTCVVLKAVKCLSIDELEDLNVIQKICKRYVIKYKSGRQKSLERVKQDWSVLYTSIQKLADSAKNAKLIKSVRNFNDEVILQKERKFKRPYSAPARTKKRPSSLKSASLRRPATANSAYERRSTFSASSGRSWMDIVRQNHSNYYPPKQLLTQISMDDFSKADREIMENHNETIKVKKVVNNKEKHKPIKMSLMGNIQNNLKKPVDTKNSVNNKEKLEPDKINLKENAQSNLDKKIVHTNALPKALDKTNNEQRLRELSGRLMSPVQIPRTFLDLKPIKKPIRLKPLKITSVVTKKEKGRKPKAATPWITKVKHARTKSKALPKPVLEHKNAKPMATKLKSARPKSEPIPKAVLEPNNAKPLASKVKHARPKSAPISKVVLEPKVAKPLATKVKHVRPKSEPVPKTVTPRTTKPKQTRPTSEPQVARKKVIKADHFLRTVKAEAAKSMATKLKSLRPKSEPLPEIVRKGIKPIAKPKADSFPRTRKANVGTTANPQKKSKRLMDASFENIPKVNSAPMDKTQQEQSVTTKEGFTKRDIANLVKTAITQQHIEQVAADRLFHRTDLIDAFFKHLEKTNKTDKFLHAQNFEEHELFQKVDGSKVQFSFLHYCVYNLAKNSTSGNDIQEYLVKQVLNSLACNHGDDADSEICCWKCAQKNLAMEVAISFGNIDTCKLLQHGGVPYKEGNLQSCVKVENIALLKEVIADLKKGKTWNPKSAGVSEALYLARYKGLKQFVRIFEAEGVGDNRARCVTCLPWFF